MTPFPDPETPAPAAKIEVVHVSAPRVEDPKQGELPVPPALNLKPGEMSPALLELLGLIRSKQTALAPLRATVGAAKATLDKHLEEYLLLEREIDNLRDMAHTKFREEMVPYVERLDTRSLR